MDSIKKFVNILVLIQLIGVVMLVIGIHFHIELLMGFGSITAACMLMALIMCYRYKVLGYLDSQKE